jgi:hypothetical protein
MKRKLSFLAVVVCMAAAPAMADLIGFSVHDPLSSWNGAGSYSVSWGTDTELTMSRNEAPLGTIHLLSSTPTLGDFTMALAVFNIGASTADATGSFTITDTDATADTITGNITGTFQRLGSTNILISTLSNVLFNDNGTADGEFDGDDGALSMSFYASEPWDGTLTQTLGSGPWFGQSGWRVTDGSVDAVVLPVPAAAILGLLGLGVAGWRLRRFA